MPEKIDVFLLAAGEANRMYPLNQIIEKSLLPVDGKPVIRHIVDKLLKCKNIRNIFISCLGKFQNQFTHEFRDIKNIGFMGFPQPEGTYDTWSTTALFYIHSSWIMVHYADCLTDIDYNDFISHIDESYDGLIAVTGEVKHDYSEVFFYNDFAVKTFIEKPKVSNYTWSGIGLFNSKKLYSFGIARNKSINIKNNKDFAFDIFPKMIKKKKLKAYPYNGYWYDLGNLNSYRKVCELYDKNNGENK